MSTITRDDLEGKLREIEVVVDDTAKQWSMWIVGGIAVTAVVVIGLKMWRSRHQKITVEVYTQP